MQVERQVGILSFFFIHTELYLLADETTSTTTPTTTATTIPTTTATTIPTTTATTIPTTTATTIPTTTATTTPTTTAAIIILKCNDTSEIQLPNGTCALPDVARVY